MRLVSAEPSPENPLFDVMVELARISPVTSNSLPGVVLKIPTPLVATVTASDLELLVTVPSVIVLLLSL